MLLACLLFAFIWPPWLPPWFVDAHECHPQCSLTVEASALPGHTSSKIKMIAGLLQAASASAAVLQLPRQQEPLDLVDDEDDKIHQQAEPCKQSSAQIALLAKARTKNATAKA